MTFNQTQHATHTLPRSNQPVTAYYAHVVYEFNRGRSQLAAHLHLLFYDFGVVTREPALEESLIESSSLLLLLLVASIDCPPRFATIIAPDPIASTEISSKPTAACLRFVVSKT